MKVKYRKTVNQGEQEAYLQSVQPEDFVSPLAEQKSNDIIVKRGLDLSWARSQRVQVPLSESLGTSGKWVYSIEEVQDVFGNVISYTDKDHDSQERNVPKAPHLHQVITVHERPVVKLDGCNSQRPLKVARGHAVNFPVQCTSSGKGGFLDPPYVIDYTFTPEADILPSGNHGPSPKRETVTMNSQDRKPRIQESGLYTLQSVRTEFCTGEVIEPSSCLLTSPPEPQLKLEKQEIFDKCAHKAIGLRVDFYLTGTPPFQVQYIQERREDKQRSVGWVTIDGLSGQKDLTPTEAGHYTYRFTEVNDATYKGHPLSGDLVLEQDVKPSASATLDPLARQQTVCIDDTVTLEGSLRGEGPFLLEYDLIQGSRRTSHKLQNIDGDRFRIQTEKLTKGGDYTLSLASVTDSMGCKEFLKEEARINVRLQKPKGAFGLIEGGRMVKTLEGKKLSLPVRLNGEPPWTVDYRSSFDPERKQTTIIRQPNDRIEVSRDGTYEILSVKDRQCPGLVDENANKFEVQWIPRPRMQIAETSYKVQQGDRYMKHDICEGDEDLAELHFHGRSYADETVQSNIAND